MIFVKNSRGGREVKMINTVGVNLNLDNVCKYTVFFFLTAPLSDYPFLKAFEGHNCELYAKNKAKLL